MRQQYQTLGTDWGLPGGAPLAATGPPPEEAFVAWVQARPFPAKPPAVGEGIAGSPGGWDCRRHSGVQTQEGWAVSSGHEF